MSIKDSVSRRAFLGGAAAASAAAMFGNPVGLVSAAPLYGPAAQGKPFRVGAIGKAMDQFWSYCADAMASAMKKVGGEVIIRMPDSEDVPKQREFMEGFIAEGVDAILFGASDPEAFNDLVKDAIEKKIIVGTWEADAAPSGRLVYSGGEDFAYGYKAGKAMAEKLGGKGQVAILQGSATAFNAIHRGDGMEKALTEAGCEVVIRDIDKEDQNVAMQHAEQLIATYPDLRGFLGIYIYHIEIAAQAVKSANKVGTIEISGTDPGGKAYDFVKDGTVFAAFTHSPFNMAASLAMWAYNMKTFGPEHAYLMCNIDATKPTADRKILMPDITITQENVDAFLKHQDELAAGNWGFDVETLA